MLKRKRKLALLLSILLLSSLLTACAGTPGAVPAETPAPESPSLTPAPAETAAVSVPDDRPVVRVADMAGFLAALASNTVIEIESSQLKLERAPDYGFSYEGGCYSWRQSNTREYALIIRGLTGLTIRGAADGGTTVSTDAISADVLRFEGCDDLSLEALTLGHRGEAGGCDGDVLSFEGCERTELKDCELFGCGVVGVNAFGCTKLHMENCTVRDCQMAALNITCCTDFQARDCKITRCGSESPLGVLCAASCEGFALINSSLENGSNSYLLDVMNSSAVCLLGCEAKGNRFSNALFCLYDNNITVSGCALSENEFGACYGGGAYVAKNGAGQELLSFQDFARMALKRFEGDYIGPEPAAAHKRPAEELPDGERSEVHVTTVDELLAAIAPRTTVFLDAEEFDLSLAADYGTRGGDYYRWQEVYDGYELVLADLDGFSLVGGGMGVTLLSAQPRYADVLSFSNCRDISLEDMTLGHQIEPGFCTGDVLSLSWSEGVRVSRCGLFGCGEIGVNALCCSDLSFSDCNIYDCSYLGANLDRVQDVLFSGCSITNCGGEYGFNGLMLSECSGVFYDTQRLYNGQQIIS